MIKISKIELGWERASFYLDNMSRIRRLFLDEEFRKAFKVLSDIVDKHTHAQYDGDIVATYVAIEQLVKDKN